MTQLVKGGGRLPRLGVRMETKHWVVYAISNDEGVPFYIGCTSDLRRRSAQHAAYINTSNPKLASWIASCYYPPLFEKLAELDNESEAYQVEAEYIRTLCPVFNTVSIDWHAV